MFGNDSEKIREELCLMFRERRKREGERKKDRKAERKKGKKNPRPPEIVFYVTWLAADVIASD